MTKTKKKKKSNLITISLIILIILATIVNLTNNEKNIKINYQNMYISGEIEKVKIYNLENNEDVFELVEEKEISRGTKVLDTKKQVTYQNEVYNEIIINDKNYYINKNNLTKDIKEVVKEKYIYTRSATTILESIDSIKITGLSKKNDKLEVLGYDVIDNNGKVNLYHVKTNNIEGYIYGKYTTITEEEAKANYLAETYDRIHGKVKNLYNGGEAIKLDFYPNEKPKFENNVMPESVYALYLNCSSNVINNIDSYIEFAKDTKINAFVIDIKDNESPAYPAETFKNLSPTNFKHSINSYEDYKNAIQRLRDANFYVIGRITVFKDNFYVQDHKEDAIINKSTGEPYLHNGSYWPSAYDRDVWYFNVSLAKEAVLELGFNEINFDYVRFPDRMNSVQNIVDLKNIYEEDKVEAIQRFVQYAKDVLHSVEAYISIDVFGETTNSTYTTAYGQYWPAISNEADVISGMPYPDHFSAGSYGLAKPWNNPYQLMKYWGSYANDRQKEIPTPALVRTWIQSYDVMKYVDSNGIKYGAEEVEAEIRGLYESGLTGGYITWLSNSSLEKYQTQRQAFSIDYRKEYINE